jgi:hypothetical protein
LFDTHHEEGRHALERKSVAEEGKGQPSVRFMPSTKIQM